MRGRQAKAGVKEGKCGRQAGKIGVFVLVAQSCLTPCNPMECSPPASSVHGDSPGKTTREGGHALLQGVFLTQGLNLGLKIAEEKGRPNRGRARKN